VQVTIPFKVPVEREKAMKRHKPKNVATFFKVISASAVNLVHSSLSCNEIFSRGW